MKKNFIQFAIQAILFFLFASTVIAQSPGGVGTGNLKIWLKAGAGITDTINGSTVNSWTDQASSLPFVADYTHGTTDPILAIAGINFNPAVKYTGSAAHSIAAATGPMLMDATVFFVGKQSAMANDGYHAIWGAGSASTTAQSWSPYIFGNIIGASAQPASMGFYSTLTWDTSESSLIRSRVNTSNDIILSKKGGVETTLPSGILDPVNNADNQFYFLGNNIDGTTDQPFGLVSETLIYNSASLSAGDIQRIESYLAFKYGISLDQTTAKDYLASNGTTKMWNAIIGSSSGFNHGIFGIGKDVMGFLDQRIAQSAERAGGTVLTIATINDFTSPNTAAIRTPLSDKNFLSIANNDGVAAWSNSNTLTGFSFLRRQWQVQKTGTPGNIWLQFDTDDPTFDIPALKTGNKYYIIIDADGDGNYSNAIATALIPGTGGLWSTATAIALANGSKFTLATQSDGVAPGGVTAGLVLWLKANAGTSTTTDNSVVNTWTDYNNISLQATNNPTYITSSINYNPAVFYSASDFHTLPLPGGIAIPILNSTVFLAGIPDPSSTSDDHHGTWISDDNSDYPLIINANRVGHYGNGDMEPVELLPWNNGDPSFAVEQIFSNNDAAISKQGSAAALISAAAIGSGNYHYLGSEGTHGFGEIAETMIYDNTAMSNSDIQKINSYFALKYGTTLDNSAGGTSGNYVLSNGSAAWSATAGANYQHHVIGIVRDNTSGLLQRQSTTSDDSLKIFVGSLATDNISNTGNINNNFSSLMIGDDGGNAVMSTTSSMPLTLKVRFGKTWKITNNNFDGFFSIEIKWDSSNLVDLNNFRLVVSSSENFATAPSYGTPDVIFTSGSIIISNLNSSIIPHGTSFITVGSTTYSLLSASAVFNANVTDDNKVALTWNTSTASSDDYFTVERSINGNYWETVTKLKAESNGPSVQNYSAADKNPYTGISFYRLKQTDYNGHSVYSDVRSVKIEKRNNLITIYPIPVTTQLNIKGDAVELKTVRVYTLSGQDVTTMIKSVELSSTHIVLDVSRLPKSTYTIKTTNTATNIVKQ